MTSEHINAMVENENSILFITLSQIFGDKMNLAQIKFFGLFIWALCWVQTVCYEELATSLDAGVSIDSSILRI